MRDGGRHRACLQAVALNVAESNVVCVLVALDDRDLQDVLLEIDPVGIPIVGRDDLAGDHADDAARARVLEIIRRQRPNVERVMRTLVEIRLDLRGREVEQCRAVPIELALLEDHLDVEIFEVVDDGKVGQIAGRDGAAVVQQEIARRMVARSFDGDDRVDAVFVDGLAADIVDVALLEQVVRMLVIGAEHAALGILRRQQRSQRLKVPRRRALADHDELSAAQLGQRVLDVGALVVGIDARSDVRVEILAGQARCVAVDLLVVRLRGDDLRDDLGVVVRDAVGVHHLGEALHARIVVERIDGAIIKIRAALVHRRRRDAGRQHEPHIDRQALGRLEHIINAVGAHDVGDLVRIGDDGGRPVDERRLRKLARRHQAGLEVDVRVDEAGADDLAGHVVFDFTVILPKAHDQAVCARDVTRAQLIREHVDIRRVFQHQIGLFPAGGRLDHALFAQQFPLNFSCVALHRYCHRVHPFLCL